MNSPDIIIKAGDIVINHSRHIVTAGGREVSLTPGQYRLLMHLAQHPGVMFSEADLLYDVMKHNIDADVESTAARTQMNRLRKALGMCGSKIINVKTFGYKLEV